MRDAKTLLAKPSYKICFLGLLLAYIFLVATLPIWDSDVWWHLRVGEWIVEHHQFPVTDIFSSIHPDREWKSFNWLFEVMLYDIHQWFGFFGIRIFTTLVIVSGFSLWFIYFFKQTKNFTASSALLLLLLVLFADRICVRPHVFNMPFEALTMLFFQSGGKLKTWRGRMLFFTLGVCWSNIHNPCAMIGVGVVWSASLWRLLIEKMNGRPFSKLYNDFFWPTSLSLLALFTNPYGANLVALAIANIAPIYDSLGEWKRPFTYLKSDAPLNFVDALTPICTLIFCSIVLLTVWVMKGFHKNREWILKAGGFMSFVMVSQTATEFIYLSVSGLSWALSQFNLRSKQMRIFFVASMFALCLVLVNYQIVRQGGMSRVLKNFNEDIWPGYYPEAAVTIIDEAHLSGKVFSPTFWGGYLLWFARPPRGVAFDGRNNLNRDETNILDKIALSLGNDPNSLLEALDELKIEIAVLPRNAFAYSHWPNDQWIRIASDAVTEVFLRTESPDMIPLRNFFQLAPSAKPSEVESAATYFFGELYFRSNQTKMLELRKKQDEDSFFDLIEMYRIANYNDEAIELLAEHLRKDPSNIQTATTLALVLHDEGKIADALQLLSPIRKSKNIPPATQGLWEHLRAHEYR